MLKDAFQWIWDKLLELWPVGVMDEWQRGIRLTLGKVTAELEPGAYIRVPFVQRVVEVEITTRTESITPVPVTTEDGFSIMLGGNIRFRVVNVKQYLTKLQNPLQTLLNEGENCLAQIAAKMEWRTVDSAAIEAASTELRDKMQAIARRQWGIEIEHAQLTHFVEAKAYRVFGDFSGTMPIFDDEIEAA